MPDAEPSLGRKILGFFIKDEEPAPPATGVPPSQPVGAPRPPAPAEAAVPVAAPGSAAPAPTPPTGAVDTKFAEHLATVLAQHNQPGPDYFEFRETLRGLAGLGLPEDKQFQAAWASFKALGGPANVGVLTNTASQYLSALAKDREGFSKSVEAALTERVGGLQSEQQRLKSENETLLRQQQEIEQKLATNTARLSTIEGDMHEQRAKIDQNRQQYEATYTHFTDQIKADIAKLTQYLA
ncbi:hypothetical protein [Spirosoma luteolum]